MDKGGPAVPVPRPVAQQLLLPLKEREEVIHNLPCLVPQAAANEVVAEAKRGRAQRLEVGGPRANAEERQLPGGELASDGHFGADGFEVQDEDHRRRQQECALHQHP